MERTSGALLDLDASEAGLELRAVDGLQALFGHVELRHDCKFERVQVGEDGCTRTRERSVWFPPAPGHAG